MTAGIVTRVFDPADDFAPLADPIEVTGPSIFTRGGRWRMWAATEVGDRLDATPDPDDPHKIGVLPQERSRSWDQNGGRHCQLLFLGDPKCLAPTDVTLLRPAVDDRRT